MARMGGRDPHEPHRAATPLELFFDLTFVIAFGVAGSQFAHEIAEAHFAAGLLGFGFAMFAVIWAWMNFTWFASAYDTDDWIFRVVTMVQLLGVLILAMGIEPLFQSLVEGKNVNNAVIVGGYVIMRLALVFQWMRASRQDPTRRVTCLRYARYFGLVQLGWIAVLVIQADVLTTILMMIVPLFILEMAAPYFAERNTPTPWHAHHIAERYGLLAIIALGECLIGAIETLRAIVAPHGWSLDAALVGFGGTALAFGMWWMYFILPAGWALHLRRHRAIFFAYGHMPVFAAIAATGAGLHVVAYFIDHEGHISAAVAIASVAVPVAIFKVSLTWLLCVMICVDRIVVAVAAGVIAAMAGSIGMAAAGVPVPACLLVIVLALGVSIVIDERRAAVRMNAALEQLGKETRPPRPA
jgi:low temperature requirement protein LtrA